jgi:hypothetical protein
LKVLILREEEREEEGQPLFLSKNELPAKATRA